MTVRNSIVRNCLLALILLGVAGCTESSVDPGDHHEEPEGILLTVDGVEVLRLVDEQTDVLPDLRLGDSSAVYEVRFLSGENSFLPEEDEGYGLDIRVADSSIARTTSGTLPGDWSFQLEGVGAGKTTVQVVLMHGSHADFISGDLSLEVIE